VLVTTLVCIPSVRWSRSRRRSFTASTTRMYVGTLLATQEAVKLFGEKGGSIIDIGTAGTRNPGPAMGLYLSTKGSIDIITQVLAKELGPKKIRVNSINPGGTETEGAHALGVMGSEFEKHVISLFVISWAFDGDSTKFSDVGNLGT
jgi:NAD(P)-dependent dehydrogenase (short-subunit alcohol dehydrogenase family)